MYSVYFPLPMAGVRICNVYAIHITVNQQSHLVGIKRKLIIASDEFLEQTTFVYCEHFVHICWANSKHNRNY